MPKKKDRTHLVGQRFGRLVVISKETVGYAPGYAPYIPCRCDCGVEKLVRIHRLEIGRTKSCGCAISETNSEKSTRHGHSSHKEGGRTREYVSWQAMNGRCRNPRNKAYRNYGALGITVCDRWVSSFESFLEDMGPRPTPTHSIDRINPNAGYFPENCRWATRLEQSRNKRGTTRIELLGLLLTFGEWQEITGTPCYRMRSRIKSGRSPADAIFPTAGDSVREGLTAVSS